MKPEVPRCQGWDGGAQRLIGADARHACRDLGSGNPELPKRKRGQRLLHLRSETLDLHVTIMRFGFGGVLKHGVFRLDCTPLSIALINESSFSIRLPCAKYLTTTQGTTVLIAS